MHGRLGVWFGVAVLSSGILVLFAQLQPSAHLYDHARRWWPAVIIALGAVGLLRLATMRTVMRGPLVLILVGTVALALNNHWIPAKAVRFAWPFLLITLGVVVLVRLAIAAPTRQMSELSRVIAIGEARHFKWPDAQVAVRKVVVVASGCTIDFQKSAPKDSRARLEITAIGSGVDVVVPEPWRVEVNNRPILGRCRESVGSTTTDATDVPTLQIAGLAIISGIDVRRP